LEDADFEIAIAAQKDKAVFQLDLAVGGAITQFAFDVEPALLDADPGPEITARVPFNRINRDVVAFVVFKELRPAIAMAKRPSPKALAGGALAVATMAKAAAPASV
jgi:hypothetical protein